MVAGVEQGTARLRRPGPKGAQQPSQSAGLRTGSLADPDRVSWRDHRPQASSASSSGQTAVPQS